MATCGCRDVTNEGRVEGCGEAQHLRKQELHCSHCAEVLDVEISAPSKIDSLWSGWYMREEKVLTASRLCLIPSLEGEGRALCDAVLFCVLVSLKIQMYQQS